MSNKPQRVDPGLVTDGRSIMKIRYEKGLAKFSNRDLGLPEFTRLLRRCENYPKCLEELRTKPKRII